MCECVHACVCVCVRALVAFFQFSRTSLIQQEWKSLLQRVHRRQKEMERKPHGDVECSGVVVGVCVCVWGVAVRGGSRHSGFCIFLYKKSFN